MNLFQQSKCRTLAIWAAIVVLTAALNTAGWARQQDEDRGLGGGLSGSNQADDAAANPRETRRLRAINMIIREINELVPGDYDDNPEAASVVRQIAERFVEGDGLGAGSAINKLTELDPNAPPKGLLLAGVNYAVNNSRAGQPILERTAVDEPDHPAVTLAFARLALSQNRLTDALALVEKAERQLIAGGFSDVEKSHYDLSNLDVQFAIAMRQARFDDALQLVTKWEQLAPDNTKMLLGRADVEFQMNKLDASKAYLKKFVEATPNSRPLELILATWFQRKGNDAGTEEWIKKAADKYPENAVVQLEYGNWAISQEDFDTAGKAIETVEEKNGESSATRMMKGRIAFAKGDYADAESLFDQLFYEQPSNFDVSNMYALSLIESNDPTKRNQARQVAQRNAQALPSNQIAQAALGWILLKTGDSQNARNLLSRAASNSRLPPEVAFFLASMLEQQGNTAQAKIVLEPALNRKGMFLYRKRAQELMDKINRSSGLPDPDDGD